MNEKPARPITLPPCIYYRKGRIKPFEVILKINGKLKSFGYFATVWEAELKLFHARLVNRLKSE